MDRGGGKAGRHQHFIAIPNPTSYGCVAEPGLGLYSTTAEWLMSAIKAKPVAMPDQTQSFIQKKAVK